MSLIRRYAEMICELRLASENEHLGETRAAEQRHTNHLKELALVPSVLAKIVMKEAEKLWTAVYAARVVPEPVEGEPAEPIEGEVAPLEALEQTQELPPVDESTKEAEDAVPTGFEGV